MKTFLRSLAALEITLIFPAFLFMTALFLRSIQPTQFQPAHAAQQIVDWYAGRPHLGLWLLLIALPIIVFTTGAAWLAQQWHVNIGLRDSVLNLLAILRSQASAIVVFGSTFLAAAILAIVALHLLTD